MNFSFNLLHSILEVFHLSKWLQSIFFWFYPWSFRCSRFDQTSLFYIRVSFLVLAVFHICFLFLIHTATIIIIVTVNSFYCCFCCRHHMQVLQIIAIVYASWLSLLVLSMKLLLQPTMLIILLLLNRVECCTQSNTA